MTSLRYHRQEPNGYNWQQDPAYIQQQQRVNNRWNGHAVAAFALCFLPGFITSILAVSFGARAVREIGLEGGRGRRLAIASILISSVLFLSLTVGGIVLGALRANGSLNPEATALTQLNKDMVATESQMKAALAANPNAYAGGTDVPVVSQPGEIITVTYVSVNTWFVKGHLAAYGNPNRDYIDRPSWITPVYSRFQGTYNNYLSIVQQNCGCNTSDQESTR